MDLHNTNWPLIESFHHHDGAIGTEMNLNIVKEEINKWSQENDYYILNTSLAIYGQSVSALVTYCEIVSEDEAVLNDE